MQIRHFAGVDAYLEAAGRLPGGARGRAQPDLRDLLEPARDAGAVRGALPGRRGPSSDTRGRCRDPDAALPPGPVRGGRSGGDRRPGRGHPGSDLAGRDRAGRAGRRLRGDLERPRRADRHAGDVGADLPADVGRRASPDRREVPDGDARATATSSLPGRKGSCARRSARSISRRSRPTSTAGSPAGPGPSTSGRTVSPCPCAASAGRRRTASGSGRSTRRRTSADAATRAPSSPRSARPSSTRGDGSASCSPTRRTRPPTTSTRRSATSRSATWTRIGSRLG